ncbi:MAG: hypothetical protein HQM10_23990 [Candidatus Riflebacteria bacterium]|nr:hypothetical protein [Candidatus Riflebacteria bacterium]
MTKYRNPIAKTIYSRNWLVKIFIALVVAGLRCSFSIAASPAVPEELNVLCDFDNARNIEQLQLLQKKIKSGSPWYRFLPILDGKMPDEEDSETVFKKAENSVTLISDILKMENDSSFFHTIAISKLFDAFFTAPDSIEGKTIGKLILFRLLKDGKPVTDLFSFTRFLKFNLAVEPDISHTDTISSEAFNSLLFLYKSDIKNMSEFARKHPFNSFVQYCSAKAFIKSGSVDEGKTLLAKAMVLDPTIKYALKKDPIISKIDLFEFINSNLYLEKITPRTASEIDTVDIHYNLTNHDSKTTKVIHFKHQDGVFFDEKEKKRIPSFLINGLFENAAKFEPSSFPVTLKTHFDNYPELLIRITEKNGPKTLLFSSSNAPGMLPFNVFKNNQSGIIESERFATAIKMLFAWLEFPSPVFSKSAAAGNFEYTMMPAPESSSLEIIFKEEAQIPAVIEFEPEIPEAIKALDFFHSSVQTTKILGENTLIQRFSTDFQELEGKTNVKIVFHKIINDGKSSWFMGSPVKFFNASKEAMQNLKRLCKINDNMEIEISPDLTFYERAGIPQLSDLIKSSEALCLSYSSADELNGEAVPIKITANSPNAPVSFTASYFPGTQKLFLRFWDKIPAEESIHGLFLNWLGFDVPPMNLNSLSFDEGKFILEFSKTPEEEVDDHLFKKTLDKRLRMTSNTFKNINEVKISSSEMRVVVLLEKNEGPGIFIRPFP